MTKRRDPIGSRLTSSRTCPSRCKGSRCTPTGAILLCAEVPEWSHEATIWLMPKGTTTGDLDA